jgi:hypothetical protein
VIGWKVRAGGFAGALPAADSVRCGAGSPARR